MAFLRTEGGFAGRRYGLGREARVLPVAAALGLPVPRVLGTPGDPPGLLMDVIPGTSRPEPEQVEMVAPEYVALVGRVHAADPAVFPVEQYPCVSDAVSAELEWWTRYAEESGSFEEPMVRLAARVLRATLPTANEPPVVVHGDVGAGNFMVDGGRVTAMLDWELAHVGDLHEDLAWLWMRGAHTPFGEPRRRLAEYESATGRVVDSDRLRWNLAFVMWKSCVGMYAELRRPPNPASFVQSMVILTYDALLGSQLLRLFGGSLQLLEQPPIRRSTPATQPADRLLETGELRPEERLVVSYLRDVAAQSRWEHDALSADLQAAGLPPSSLLVECIDRVDAGSETLPKLLRVLARAADRAAMALPNAVRRVQRAQAIGLGTTADPTRKEPR